MLKEFTDFWRKCDLSRKPYMHPEDQEFQQKKEFKSIINGCLTTDDKSTKLHLSLLPAPYTGNLAQADIVLIYLNPGAGKADYDDQRKPKFRERLERNLRQDFRDTDCPFLSLDPNLEWTAGYEYWEKKLRGVLHRIADEKFDGDPDKALRFLSNKIATVELIPYKSYRFDTKAPFKSLPSVQKAKKFIHGWLTDRAKAGEKTIIVTRGVRRLDYDYDKEPKGFVIYPRKQAQSASLSPQSKGGKAILKSIGIT